MSSFMSTNDVKKRLKDAMEKRATTITNFLLELHRDGKTKHKYCCPFVRWEDCSRYMGSCWGSEIADVYAYIFKDGTFIIVHKGEPVEVVDEHLKQALKRAMATANCYSRGHVGFETIRSGPTYLSLAARANHPKKCHVVKTNKGTLVFDYVHKGSVHVCNTQQKWTEESRAVVPDHVAEKCDSALSEGIAQRFVSDGRDAYAIPNKDGTVTLFGFSAVGAHSIVSKVEHPIYKEYKEDGTGDAVVLSQASGELDQAVIRVSGSDKVWEVFSSPEGRTCAAFGNTSFTVLNMMGDGEHVTASYNEGYEVPLFTVRHENFNETVIRVPLHKFKAVATDPDGSNPRMMQLYEMLQQAGVLGKHAGIDEGVDLSDPKDKEEWATLRIQAYLVPGDKGTEVYEKVYSYQTHSDDQPSCLYTYHTGFGTTWATSTARPCKIQPSSYNAETGENSAFNLSIEPSKKRARDAATYTQADNEANVSSNRSMAVPLGPLGFPKLANATAFAQFPVEVPPPKRSRMGGDGGSVFRSLGAPMDVDGDSGPEYRSLSADMPEGDLMASTTGLGSYQGQASGVKNGALKRRRDAAPTITFSIFFSIVPKEGSREGLLPGEFAVSKEDVAEVVRQMDELHEIAGEAKKLFDPDAGIAEQPSAAQATAVMDSIAKKQRFVAAPKMAMVAM